MVGSGSPVLYLSMSLSHSPFQMARETLHWDRPFKTVRSGSFENGDVVWFPEGGLNASYNCVDRWAHTQPDKVRIESPFDYLVHRPSISNRDSGIGDHPSVPNHSVTHRLLLSSPPITLP